jgi:type IV pilus assembly protein PilA
MHPLRNRKPNSKGFTLVELLVVILILAILMAVALPLYLGAVSDSQKKTCRANMQTIANACQAYRTRSATHSYPAHLSDLTTDGQDLQALPKCPSHPGDNYKYYVNDNNQIAIACPGHAGEPDPAGDSGSDSGSGDDHGQFVPGKDAD